jgi:DnaJ-class molecular chaperone
VTTDYKDYYKILGVSKDANQKTIQQAYRKLARQYHPDVNPGNRAAEEKFKEINEANEVLSDPEKRNKYDQMNTYYQQYGSWPGTESYRGPETGSNFRGGTYQYQTINEEDLDDLFGGRSPFSDFFDTYFRSSSRPGGPAQARQRTARRTPRETRGEDVEATVDVTLADAYRGGTQTLELSEADGKTRRLEVKIPAGVDEGSRIRIAGQGIQGTHGRGDLYLRVHMLPDPRFSRDGTTLRTRVDVPLAVAILGGEVKVPTPDGRNLLLRIPPGTANGKSFRLKGQGMPYQGKPDQRGDLFAQVHVVLPTHLTEEQRQLFEKFASSLGYDTQPSTTGTGSSHA